MQRLAIGLFVAASAWLAIFVGREATLAREAMAYGPAWLRRVVDVRLFALTLQEVVFALTGATVALALVGVVAHARARAAAGSPPPEA